MKTTKSQWIDADSMGHVLALLTPPNRLAIEVSAATGLRIGDVLALEAAPIRARQRVTVRESKTGKAARIWIPTDLRARMLAQAGEVYVWPHRLRPLTAHRTRQAVWADIDRARRALRMSANVTPHTARKIYAVALFAKLGNMEAVREKLRHTDDSVTMIYALADVLSAKSPKKRTARRRKGQKGAVKRR